MSGRRVNSIDLETIGEVGSSAAIHSHGREFACEAYNLVSRAEVLNAKDRVILKLYLSKGLTFRQIGEVAGMDERKVATRIRSLTAKLKDGVYITCLRNKDKFGRVEMAVAKDYFLDGMTQSMVAEKYGMTFYSARKMIRDIQVKADVFRS